MNTNQPTTETTTAVGIGISKNPYMAQIEKPRYRSYFTAERIVEIAKTYAYLTQLAQDIDLEHAMFGKALCKCIALSDKLREELFDDERRETESSYLDSTESVIEFRDRIETHQREFRAVILRYMAINSDTV